MGWQPIETARRDGTWMLIAIPPNKFGTKEWIVTAAMYDGCNQYGWWAVTPTRNVSDCLILYDTNVPTLWQPFSIRPTPLDIAHAEVIRIDGIASPPPKPQETP